MIRTLSYQTQGTCSRKIEIEIDGDIVRNVVFTGGCHGNTQGLSALIKGMTIEQVITKLKGIDCKGKGTSCPDQLAQALTSMQ